MNAGFKKSLIFSMLFATVVMMVATTFVQGNILYGQAVPLIQIQTGNATLDNGLPEFYDCIDEKIDQSKGVGEDTYFEKEPTKHEVTTCYNEVFFDNSDTQSTNDESDTQSTNDESELSDIERFNSLFGFTG
ncbi:hypothetical protein BH23THE1_BH23THE1_12390 [soil metagenome]